MKKEMWIDGWTQAFRFNRPRWKWIEFKSWIATPNFKQMIMLYVKEIVALANSSGGYLLLGVEDNKEITWSTKYYRECLWSYNA